MRNYEILSILGLICVFIIIIISEKLLNKEESERRITIIKSTQIGLSIVLIYSMLSHKMSIYKSDKITLDKIHKTVMILEKRDLITDEYKRTKDGIKIIIETGEKEYFLSKFLYNYKYDISETEDGFEVKLKKIYR